MRFGVIAFAAIAVLMVAVGRLVPPRWRLAAWTLIVVVGVVPWGSWVGHEHWSRVEWVPFTRIVRPRDLALNLVLYAPIGYYIGAARPHAARRVLVAAIFGGVLSCLTEFSQIYSHGRFPSMTDVVMNMAGAVLGALASGMRRDHPISSAD